MAKNSDELREELFYTMDACNEYHDDASDGAWWAIMEDCVQGFNQMKRTSFDPYDHVVKWMEWLEAQQKEKAV